MENTNPPGANHASAQLTPELSKFVENLAGYFETYGIQRIGGRILALLLVSQEPLSAEDISAILKVSRASVSNNLRFALQVGLAEKTFFPGDRVTYYLFPENGLEKTFAAEVQAISSLKNFIEQGLKALPPGGAVHGRLEALSGWTDFLMQVWQNAMVEWRARQGSK